MKRWAQKLGVLLLLLVTWETVTRLGVWSPHLFPGPVTVAKSLYAMLADGRLAAATLRSLGRLGRAYLISASIGVPLGLAIARISFFRHAVKPVVSGLQA
ncbi:MAG TPA: ABC transporter permease, partial [Myxococcaceae bacterium]|nr:ABC transporter permease [Myxococcaceae bacterium]